MNKRIVLLLFCVLVTFNVKAHVNLINPLGGEIFNSGETVNIQWEITVNHNLINWDLYFSEDGGNTWEPIALDISKDSLNFNWLVPDLQTALGQIRIVMDNDGNDYNDISENFTINTVTDINEATDNFELKVFPNPMTEKAIFTFSNINSERHTLILYSSKGQIVREMVNITSDQVIIKRVNLVNGLYFFQLSSKNEIRATGKIIIE